MLPSAGNSLRESWQPRVHEQWPSCGLFLYMLDRCSLHLRWSYRGPPRRALMGSVSFPQGSGGATSSSLVPIGVGILGYSPVSQRWSGFELGSSRYTLPQG